MTKSKFLSRNSILMILMESSLESNLNFCRKNKLIQRLTFLDKNCILPQCVSMLFRVLVTQSIFEATDIPPPTSAWFRDSAHCVGHETRALRCTLWQNPTFCSKNQSLNYLIFTVKTQIKMLEKIPWKIEFLDKNLDFATVCCVALCLISRQPKIHYYGHI